MNEFRRCVFLKGDHKYYFRWSKDSDGDLMDYLVMLVDRSDLDVSDVSDLTGLLMDSFGNDFIRNLKSHFKGRPLQQSF